MGLDITVCRCHAENVRTAASQTCRCDMCRKDYWNEEVTDND